MSRRGTVLFVALSCIWGLPYLLIRVAVRHGIDPGTLVFLRTAPAALTLLPIAWRTGALRALRGRLRAVALYGLVEFAIPLFFLSLAEQHLSSSVTGLLVATVPLLAMLVSRVTHPSDRFSAARLVGLGVGAVGVALLVGFEVAGSTWTWLLVMGIVVLGYTFGPTVLSLRLADAPGLGVVATSVGLVAAGYAPYGLTHLPASATAEAWWSVAGLALVCTAVGFLVFFELVKEIGPARSLVVTYANSAVAAALGVGLLSEHLRWEVLVGFPLVVAGSVLATRRTVPLSAAAPRAGRPRRRSSRGGRSAAPPR